MLTKEDIAVLSAPLPRVTGHEVRASEVMAGGRKVAWLTYTEEGPVKERLDEIDPAWTFEIIKPGNPCYARLTVKGVTRDCVGTGGPGADGEKGAATDALKRGARLFGVGLYLKKAPRIITDYRDPKQLKLEGREKGEAYRFNDQKKDEAKAIFLRWFDRQFPNAGGATDDYEPETVDLAEAEVEDAPVPTKPAPAPASKVTPMPKREKSPLEIAASELARGTYPYAKDTALKPWQEFIAATPKWTSKFWPTVKGALGYESNDAVHEAVGVDSMINAPGTVADVWLRLCLKSPKLSYLDGAVLSDAS